MLHPATFTALDFETAQGYPRGKNTNFSICQVGLVRVENGKIVHTFECLVKPPGNYYWDRFIEINGITHEMKANSPTFDKVWNKIEPYIKEQNVVAHNIAFDASCIKGTLEYYGLPVPEFTRRCTMQLFGGGLADNCIEHGIELNHHNALSCF
jgi:DNA polymerase-3 subunit epsilon